MQISKTVSLSAALACACINLLFVVIALFLPKWAYFAILWDPWAGQELKPPTVDSLGIFANGGFMVPYTEAVRICMITFLSFSIAIGCITVFLVIWNLCKTPKQSFFGDVGLLILFASGCICDLIALITFGASLGEGWEVGASYWLLLVAFIIRICGLVMIFLKGKYVRS